MRARLELVAVALLGIACQRAETPEQLAARLEAESRAVREELQPVIARYERAVAAGNIDSMALILAEDAHTQPPNAPMLVGRAAWVNAFRPLLAQGQWAEDIITESVAANGPMAVERGRYIMTFTPGPTAPRGAVAFADTGKYLWHWRKAAGRWALADLTWTSDRPATR